MIGTWCTPCSGEIGSETMERRAETLLGEVNDACLALGLTRGDAVRWHAGLPPLKAGAGWGWPDALARPAGDRVLAALKRPAAAGRTARTPLPCDPPPPREDPSPRLPIREEMALTRTDLAVRGTNLPPLPGPSRRTARIAGRELSWDEARRTGKVEAVMHGILAAPPAESVP